MTLSRDEAAKALNEIQEAGEKSNRLRGYRSGSPFVLMWGVQWLVANTAMNFNPRVGNWIWMVGVLLIVVVSGFIGTIPANRDTAAPSKRQRQVTLKWMLVGPLSMLCIAALFAVLWPFSQKQFTAAISLFWMCVYLIGGLWLGWRLFWIGLVAGTAILAGYFWIDQYFYLWMGLAGGGALILGGLWMRKA